VGGERPRPRAGCGSGRRFRGSRPRGRVAGGRGRLASLGPGRVGGDQDLTSERRPRQQGFATSPLLGGFGARASAPGVAGRLATGEPPARRHKLL
jgi:hypothetical protein